MSTFLNDQPVPVANEQEAIADIVLKEYGHIKSIVPIIKKRKAQGIERYKVPLQPFNGRDALDEALQEAVDGALYLRQYAEELKQQGKPSVDAMSAYHQAVFLLVKVAALVTVRQQKQEETA